MRPVNKGEPPIDPDGCEILFKKYERARRYLIDRIGEYCSYCERKIASNLAIEHVKPKATNEDLELEWSNFLLSCPNCNSTKGKKSVTLTDYYLPHIDNTYEIFSYDASGIVRVSTTLLEQTKIQKANKTIKLVGLDKIPPNKGTVTWEEASDRRFEHRIQAFEEAQDNARYYSEATQEIRILMLPHVKKIVLYSGFWSIWMQAFQDFPEVQRELINAFVGTRKEFFQSILNSSP